MKLLGILLYIGIVTAVTVDVNDPAVANRLSVPAPPSTGNEAERRDFTPAAWTELDDRADKVSQSLPYLITSSLCPTPRPPPLPFSLAVDRSVPHLAPHCHLAHSSPPTTAILSIPLAYRPAQAPLVVPPFNLPMHLRRRRRWSILR